MFNLLSTVFSADSVEVSLHSLINKKIQSLGEQLIERSQLVEDTSINPQELIEKFMSYDKKVFLNPNSLEKEEIIIKQCFLITAIEDTLNMLKKEQYAELENFIYYLDSKLSDPDTFVHNKPWILNENHLQRKDDSIDSKKKTRKLKETMQNKSKLRSENDSMFDESSKSIHVKNLRLGKIVIRNFHCNSIFNEEPKNSIGKEILSSLEVDINPSSEDEYSSNTVDSTELSSDDKDISRTSKQTDQDSSSSDDDYQKEDLEEGINNSEETKPLLEDFNREFKENGEVVTKYYTNNKYETLKEDEACNSTKRNDEKQPETEVIKSGLNKENERIISESHEINSN
ncbi:unnamed protein product [Dimorphilus gyrociliatus]|nr:unnamed protein product [Dimorphilus gyrociliatus]